jgi:hypothetical protein
VDDEYYINNIKFDGTKFIVIPGYSSKYGLFTSTDGITWEHWPLNVEGTDGVEWNDISNNNNGEYVLFAGAFNRYIGEKVEIVLG